ncbi:FAD-binding protein, partial [bacterium]|nr:FAD-binding protein [bacterium]
AHSLQEFFHLVNLGVPFPFNSYGEFVGYKTDHDPCQRGSSIGPYTSKKMTEVLEKSVVEKRIKIIDKTKIVDLLTEDGSAVGVVGINGNTIKIILAENVIFATGGPAVIYKNTVYPKSQFGASGILAKNGVEFVNLQEWQYGMGSIKFRWNLSGSFQQVIPSYVSIDEKGTKHNFLEKYFENISDMANNIFMKGYQWPFDSRKLKKGSSIIDFAVYTEKNVHKRKVYLDFTENPTFKNEKFVLKNLNSETYSYLKKSSAIGESPVKRLKKLNMPAYNLYKKHKIDLEKELLEIDALPQHNNGGVRVNKWWESNVKHLFAIGECAGTHGVYRPGGSALNSGQVGGLRAAYFIKNKYIKEKNKTFKSKELIKKVINKKVNAIEKDIPDDLDVKLQFMQEKNMELLSCVRNITEIKKYYRQLSKWKFIDSYDTIAIKYNEVLILSKLFCKSVLSYFNKYGCLSRGSYILINSSDFIIDLNKIKIHRKQEDCKLSVQIKNKIIKTKFIKVNPIPDNRELWFEKVWKEFEC